MGLAFIASSDMSTPWHAPFGFEQMSSTTFSSPLHNALSISSSFLSKMVRHPYCICGGGYAYERKLYMSSHNASIASVTALLLPSFLAVFSTDARNSVSVALHASHSTWGTSFLASAVDASAIAIVNSAASTKRNIRIATISRAGCRWRCDAVDFVSDEK